MEHKIKVQDSVTDVLIVGAGPTGLTLAVDLARRGVPFQIIDRVETPSVASRAKTIQPRSLEVMDDLGAVGRILDIGRTDLPTRFYAADGTVADRPGIAVAASDELGTPYPDPLWIAEFDVEAALRNSLARWGEKVQFGAAATGLIRDGDGVAVTLDTAGQGSIVRARYVVGADGGKSLIRKLNRLASGR